jgi:hypothetical protein
MFLETWSRRRLLAALTLTGTDMMNDRNRRSNQGKTRKHRDDKKDVHQEKNTKRGSVAHPIPMLACGKP